MNEIRTVLGSIIPEELGFTDAHEHLIVDRDYVLKLYPDYRLDNFEKTVKEVKSFMAVGGKAIVEMTCLNFGRSARKMIKVAKQTSLHIIAATGFHRPQYYMDSHWRFVYSIDQIAQIMVEEIEKGMDENQYNGVIIDRTEARAGVIKIATGYYVIEPNDEKIIHTAAIAHLETGAPIFTHTEQGTLGLEQIRILESYGVDPGHVTVGHYDRNPDFYLHNELAQTGCFLEYDTPSRRKYFPESNFIELVRKMVEAGYGKQILWGGDLSRQSYQCAYGGQPGLKYILDYFFNQIFCK
ncbi:Phospho-furanose lactonase [subsurface metagenome]